MGPDQYIRLSQLNDQIQDTINARFKGQTYWVVADIANHNLHLSKLLRRTLCNSNLSREEFEFNEFKKHLKVMCHEYATRLRVVDYL